MWIQCPEPNDDQLIHMAAFLKVQPKDVSVWYGKQVPLPSDVRRRVRLFDIAFEGTLVQPPIMEEEWEQDYKIVEDNAELD